MSTVKLNSEGIADVFGATAEGLLGAGWASAIMAVSKTNPPFDDALMEPDAILDPTDVDDLTAFNPGAASAPLVPLSRAAAAATEFHPL